MGYAILRTQKLKHAVAVRRSMTHALREQDTPNADPSRTPDNSASVGSVDEALDRFNERLATQAKVRSNAVLAVEYLITASPEDMQGKSHREQDDYFRDALKWLQAKHGKENVVYAGIHRDEQTPHMYAYVVPIDERGKLNCRAFLGGAKALIQMQTDFASAVGRKHGLARGLEGSRARHTSIRQYYARVRAATPSTPVIDVPRSKPLEPSDDYGRRVARSVLDQLAPELQALRAKAQQHAMMSRATKRVAIASYASLGSPDQQADFMGKLLYLLKLKPKDAAISDYDYLKANVTVGGEAFQVSKHLVSLEKHSMEWDLQDVPLHTKVHLFERATRLKEAIPEYDAPNFIIGMDDIADEVNQHNQQHRHTPS